MRILFILLAVVLFLLIVLPGFTFAFPHYYQGSTTKYCGETSLQMIAADQGKKLQLKDIVAIRKAQIHEHDLTTCSDLEKLSGLIGIPMECHKTTNITEAVKAISNGPIIAGFPAHWVVAYEVKGGKVSYNNPGDILGYPFIVPQEEFQQDFQRSGLGYLSLKRSSKSIYQQFMNFHAGIKNIRT